MAEYDISEEFERIEHELITSMMRNFDGHRAEEDEMGINWSQWQIEQLQALEEYKRHNAMKYGKEFKSINSRIDGLIRQYRKEGNTKQEVEILKAIKKGFNYEKTSPGISEKFFKLNDKKIDALIDATTRDFEKAEYALLRRANDQYRQIVFSSAFYATTGGTYEKAVDMATKDFMKKGIDCIEYKNGSRHNIKDYADMAIKTAGKRAYLTGEGEKRKEYGISTVIMNKRGNPCPLCRPFCGKVMVDDVWSGGSPDGISPVTGIKYPTMSSAVAAGLYHPRCRDAHSTYYEGISTMSANDEYTKEELATIAEDYKKEQELNHVIRQIESFSRLAAFSLDNDNKKRYESKKEQWENVAKDRFNILSNNNKSNPKYYNINDKDINKVESEISQLDYEVGVIFDKNGKAISCQLGSEDEVAFTKHQCKLMKGNDVTHNHPLSTPPSPEDLYLLVRYGAKSLRTCGKNGTYVLEYSKELSNLPKFEVFSNKYDDLVESLRYKYIEEVSNGMAKEEALIKLGEEVWDKLYNIYGIKLTFERR